MHTSPISSSPADAFTAVSRVSRVLTLALTHIPPSLHHACVCMFHSYWASIHSTVLTCIHFSMSVNVNQNTFRYTYNSSNLNQLAWNRSQSKSLIYTVKFRSLNVDPLSLQVDTILSYQQIQNLCAPRSQQRPQSADYTSTDRQINCSLDIRLPFIHSYLCIQVTNIHLTLNHFHQVIVPNLILFPLLLQANNKPTNYLICGNINQLTNKGCIQCRDLSMFNTLIGENFGFTITRCSFFCDFFSYFPFNVGEFI